MKKFKADASVLLHPNIPKPLHGLNPRTIMGKDWWDEHRQVAYASTNYHCIACGVHKSEAKYHKWLEAHEFYEMDYAKGTMTFIKLIPLCHSCHNFIHSGRLLMLYEAGKIPFEKYHEITLRGVEILEDAGLRKEEPTGKTAKWEDWVLVFEGKRYKGKFKTYETWKEFYSR